MGHPTSKGYHFFSWTKQERKADVLGLLPKRSLSFEEFKLSNQQGKYVLLERKAKKSRRRSKSFDFDDDFDEDYGGEFSLPWVESSWEEEMFWEANGI